MTIDERARRLDELEAAALATRGIRFLLATTSPDAYVERKRNGLEGERKSWSIGVFLLRDCGGGWVGGWVQRLQFAVMSWQIFVLLLLCCSICAF